MPSDILLHLNTSPLSHDVIQCDKGLLWAMRLQADSLPCYEPHNLGLQVGKERCRARVLAQCECLRLSGSPTGEEGRDFGRE